MLAPVFVSYSWHQGEWVWDRLVPILKAGGMEVLIDREKFEAALPVERQMDEVQDRAGLHILVFSPEYLASKACQREMKRSIARDPKFQSGVTVPVLRVDCKLPAAIVRPNPLYVDLCDDGKPDPWDLLLRKCGLDLGIDAPGWLRARDDVRRLLNRVQSVNLVVTGKAQWRPLIEHLLNDPALGLGLVRLDSTEAMHRPSLVQAVLAQCGCPISGAVPGKPEDLVVLGRSLKSLPQAARLALTSFDHVSHRLDEYEVDLFAALRDVMMNEHKLVLLIESHSPLSTLLPQGHPMSEIHVVTVELKGRP
jgi:hypothetical protein